MDDKKQYASTVDYQLDQLFDQSIKSLERRAEAEINVYEKMWTFQLNETKERRERYLRLLNTHHDFSGVSEQYEKNVHRLYCEWDSSLDLAIETGQKLITLRSNHESTRDGEVKP